MEQVRMEHLTPQQVARAIGVSTASLKRWCDKGVLPSIRTEGGHRRLPISGVIRFLQESGRQLVRPEILRLPPTTANGRTVINRAAQHVCDALLSGDDPCVQRIIFDLHFARCSVADICDNVVAPAFAEIGERWARGQIEIYQERRACEVCNCVLRRLSGVLPAPSDEAPLAIGGTPAGDHYTLATSMAALVLRGAGWRAESFGSNLPVDTLLAAVRTLHPRLLWLSVSATSDAARFETNYRRLSDLAASAGVAIAVGGRRLDAELRAHMRFDVYCTRVGELVAFAESLEPAPAK